MSRIGSFFILFVALVLFAVGGQIVASQFKSDTLGDYTRFYTTAENDTDVTGDSYHLLNTNRPSDHGQANLTIRFDDTMCTGDSNVSVNDTRVGNLSGGSPKTFIDIPGEEVHVPAHVNYELEPDCPVNHSALDYLRYSGCEADEETCDTLETSFNITTALFTPMGALILLVGMVIIGFALLMF